MDKPKATACTQNWRAWHSRFGDLDVLEAGDAIGFEAAEGVGESEAQFPIQFGGDEVIDAATVGGECFAHRRP